MGKKVREEVPLTNSIDTPVLIDTLPSFLDNIAEAVSVNHIKPTANAFNNIATEHGGERARLTAYNHRHLIREYQLLRWVLIETLEEAMQVEKTAITIIHASIDEAIQQAATSFSLVQERLREQYMATLSHDMKTPLSSITMASGILLRQSQDPSVLKQASKIKHSANRLNQMIEDLLDLTSVNMNGRLKLKLEQCDVYEISEEVMDEIEFNAKNKRLILTGEKVQGLWDRSYLKRAIENLISNAIKYGDKDSSITIKISTTFGRMTWTIHNEGSPIPLEERECIFQVFRRAEAAKSGRAQGWGLGLPLVRAVCESHGGSIGVDSSSETGTTFIIDIPIDSSPYQQAPALPMM
ncbi:sensor histidine kinase [Peredibacter starrii]|uniref:histidine kinase n=1 Tax=Peredibacter starrii TaxID=28202 RepID=A0AAX4HK24_9BACT|nr:HAMP domain-containing sensor histidine kinase [Peredibacter starrii]WPU63577.1 HAMP domain-containing sensor histidine kinase [Peredibacter starrii]